MIALISMKDQAQCGTSVVLEGREMIRRRGDANVTYHSGIIFIRVIYNNFQLEIVENHTILAFTPIRTPIFLTPRLSMVDFPKMKTAINSQMASTTTTDLNRKVISVKTAWSTATDTITTGRKVQDECQLRRRLFTMKKFTISVVLLSDAWEEVK
jgi:hypothetical protein